MKNLKNITDTRKKKLWNMDTENNEIGILEKNFLPIQLKLLKIMIYRYY
jgi:hypothetical protein